MRVSHTTSPRQKKTRVCSIVYNIVYIAQETDRYKERHVMTCTYCECIKYNIQYKVPTHIMGS